MGDTKKAPLEKSQPPKPDKPVEYRRDSNDSWPINESETIRSGEDWGRPPPKKG